MAPSPYLEDRRWAMFLPRGLLRPLGTPPVTPGTQNLYLFARKQRPLSELFFYIIIKPKIAASAKQPSFFTTILVNHGLYFQPNQEKSRVDRFPAKYHSGKKPGGPSMSIHAFPSIPTFSSIPTLSSIPTAFK